VAAARNIVELLAAQPGCFHHLSEDRNDTYR
jgi:hypothetical protein